MSISQYFDSGIVKLHRPNEAMSTQEKDYDNILVVYHAQCVDGFTAAMICWHASNFRAQLIPAEYSKPIIWPTVSGRTWILFVDFCPDIGTLNQLADMYDRVTVIDHHVSQTSIVEAFIKRARAEVLFTTERSGAYLAWLFAHDTVPLDIIQAVDDYDRWQFKLQNTKQIHAALDSRPYDPILWEMFVNPESRAVEDTIRALLVNEGNALLRQHEKHCDDIVMSQRPRFMKLVVDDGHDELTADVVGLYNAPKWFASELGNRLAKTGQIGGTYIVGREDTVVSLRSDGTRDVAEIAKRYGGGGHKAAAGFTVPNQVAEMMFREGYAMMFMGNGG